MEIAFLEDNPKLKENLVSKYGEEISQQVYNIITGDILSYRNLGILQEMGVLENKQKWEDFKKSDFFVYRFPLILLFYIKSLGFNLDK